MLARGTPVLRMEQRPPPRKRAPPVVRHVLTEAQLAAAVIHLGGGAAEDLGKRVLCLRQKEMQEMFGKIYGVPTASCNNAWLRSKLLQACGLDSGWRPASTTPARCAAPADEGDFSRFGRRRRAVVRSDASDSDSDEAVSEASRASGGSGGSAGTTQRRRPLRAVRRGGGQGNAASTSVASDGAESGTPAPSLAAAATRVTSAPATWHWASAASARPPVALASSSSTLATGLDESLDTSGAGAPAPARLGPAQPPSGHGQVVFAPAPLAPPPPLPTLFGSALLPAPRPPLALFQGAPPPSALFQAPPPPLALAPGPGAGPGLPTLGSLGSLGTLADPTISAQLESLYSAWEAGQLSFGPM